VDEQQRRDADDGLNPPATTPAGESDYVALVTGLVKSSGVYALAALTTPMVTLVLTPFLAHHLSPAEYGELTLLNAGIGLAAGITQLGLASAFMRAYNYDFTSDGDRRRVLGTVTALLALTSIPVVLAVALVAPPIAHAIFHRSSLASLVVITAGVVLASNLTVPGFSWLRGENRPLAYSLLALVQSLVILSGTVLLVGVLHLGVAGALIGMICGYAGVALCTVPVLLVHSGIRPRGDVAWSLLAFGAPIALGGVSTWVLQLSDRYLLNLFRSLAETGWYAVGYTLGSALAVAIITPFQLAWPTTMYTIARREDSAQLFRLVFRWFGLALVFSAFGLALTGRALLDWLFPPAYQPAAAVIPIVAAAWVFYGAYAILMTGANVERKTWLMAVYTTVAAGINVACNLILIPSFGAVGAAIATLIAYAALAAMAYIGNQRIHPIPFELVRFLGAVLAGAVIYIGVVVLAAKWGFVRTLPLAVVAWTACGLILLALGRKSGRDAGLRPSSRPRVCMHVLATARADVRVMREATALAGMGCEVSIVDIEHHTGGPTEEQFRGVRLRHVKMSRRHVRHYEPTDHLRWLAFKAARMALGCLMVLRTPADVYHAHDITALPPCFVASRLRRKPLVYDAHELPLVDPHIVNRPLLRTSSVVLLRAMMPRCTAVVTVSRPLASELERRYGGPTAVVVRNVPEYQPVLASDRIVRSLGLGPGTAPRIVLYQGGFQANRGLHAAVLAAKFLEPGTVVVLMGRGETQAQLEALIDRDGVSDRVKILPPVPYDELLEWTASADIGLLVNTPEFSPNVRMGLPNKLFEYLMAGVPVFASQLEAVAQLVRAYDVGCVATSLEPIDIGRALNTMLRDKERLAQMRRNALTAAGHELRWDVESIGLRTLYQSLLT
jgi:O-antigen/teichoic acid export membrane protein/glycosyltransferase involved in cell wall biosynthesis